jgi:hypothetical protein
MDYPVRVELWKVSGMAPDVVVELDWYVEPCAEFSALAVIYTTMNGFALSEVAVACVTHLGQARYGSMECRYNVVYPSFPVE